MTELNNLLETIQNIKINIGNAIENKGQTVTNFASYPNAILNIKAAEGDILLFSNLSEMNNYTNMNEGDLALVYDINTSDLQALWQYTNNSWGLAPVGLTANKEYVNSAKFWGANGVEAGVLQVNSNLTNEQVKIKAQVYSDLSYLELDPSITNLTNAFYHRNITAIPNINTTYITNISGMFWNCTSLQSIPNFNIANVINMSYTFYGCTNLTSVPNFDTLKVNNMCGTFSACTNLTSVPNFDTANVINMCSMFSYCTNLVEVPNFDTSKVTDMGYMFQKCTNLTTVPNFNTSNVESAWRMFLRLC